MSFATKNESYASSDLSRANQLHARLQTAFGTLRDRQREILALLSECLEHHVPLLLGFSSLDQYLVKEFKLPPASAWRYASAAKTLRKDPSQLELFRNGSATLTSLAQAWVAYRKCLLPARKAQLRLSSKPAPITQNDHNIRKASSSHSNLPPETAEEARTFLTAISTLPADQAIKRVQQMTHQTPPKRRTRTAKGCHVHLVLTDEELALLERLEQLWSHKVSSRKVELIFAKALEYVLEREDPLRKKPKPKPETSSGRISSSVRAAVIKRDHGQCQFKRRDGSICGSKHYIHIDHIVPRSRGGPTRLENLRCLCSTHNSLAKDRASVERVGVSIHPDTS